MRPHDAVEQRGDLRRIRDVGDARARLTVGGAQALGGRVGELLAAVGDDHYGALRGELLGDRGAEAAAGTGHDGDPALQRRASALHAATCIGRGSGAAGRGG